MTVLSTTSSQRFHGSGSAGPFTFSWCFLANNDIKVYRIAAPNEADVSLEDPVLLTEGDDYTLTGAGSYTGGSLTLATALANGVDLVVKRRTATLQTTDIRNQGNNFYPEVHEDAFDAQVMMIQDRDRELTDHTAEIGGLKTRMATAETDIATNVAAIAQEQEQIDTHTGQISRALKFPLGDLANAVLPAASARANKLQGYDAAGGLALFSPGLAAGEYVVTTDPVAGAVAQYDAEGRVGGNAYLKTPVAAATTLPITLSGEQTIDGVAIFDGMRVLVKDQYAGAANGIYVTSTGGWVRSSDCDAAAELAGAVVMVLSGDKNKGAMFRCITQGVTLGTTSLDFRRDGAGRSLADAVATGRIISQVGDSNTDNVAGRKAWQAVADLEWFGVGAPLEGWTNYNIGLNGSQIVSWLAGIPSGSTATAVTTRGNPWAAVNADPDIIVVRLGTNDFSQDSTQGTSGVLVTARAGFAKLLTFLLSGSRAHLLLVMPQPFAYESFPGVTWASADEAAEYSARMRTLYREWIGVNDRVTVYDSHMDLFGLRIDNKAVNALDPITAAPMMADSLHLSDIGFRRVAERTARLFAPGMRRSSKFAKVGNDVHMAMRFGVPVYIAATEVSGTLLTVRSEPQKVLRGNRGDLYTSDRSSLAGDTPLLDAAFVSGRHGARAELLALHNATVKIKFMNTGTIVSPTTFKFSSTAVVVSGESADKFLITGAATTETGPALIYVEKWYDNPYATREIIPVSVERTTDIIVPFLGQRGMQAELFSVHAGRIGFVGTGCSFDVYYFSGNSGLVTGTLAFTVTFVAGTALATGVLNETNFPSGVKFDARSPTRYHGFRLTNFVNFGGAGTPGTVNLGVRYYD